MLLATSLDHLIAHVEQRQAQLQLGCNNKITTSTFNTLIVKLQNEAMVRINAGFQTQAKKSRQLVLIEANAFYLS